MSGAVTRLRIALEPSAPTPEPVGRVPRIARLLALAHMIDRKIRVGELDDWADAARRLGLTRARMAQIANLLLLAPTIQEEILALPPVLEGRDPVTERRLRRIATESDWNRQHDNWVGIARV